MYILSTNFCNEPGVLNAFLIIKTILNVIKIIVPIILIIVCMLEIGKAVAANEDTLNKLYPKIITKLIAAVVIFLVPSIINLSINVIDSGNDYSTSSCWTNANKDTIASLELLKEAKRQEEKELMEMDHYISVYSIHTGNFTTLPEKMMSLALEQVGNKGVKYQSAYGMLNSEWCLIFTWWVANEVGVYPSKISYKSASTNAMYKYLNETEETNVSWENSIAKGGNYTPKKGDYIFFSYESGYVVTHVGLVVSIFNGQITYVDGNGGSGRTQADRKVALRKVKTDSKKISGYGLWY